MANKEASSSNPTATWNGHNISIFCGLCIKEVEAGHRPGTHFDKEGYANIRANFKAETGHDYERKQLKNKWDTLKNEWKLWKELVGKETGLGWNSNKGTVDASEEWWNNKIQDVLEHSSTGEHAWAPSSGVLPPETREEFIGQIDLDDEEESETMQDLRQATRKGKKRAANQEELQKKVDKKGKKIGGAAKLCGQIDRLVEVYESRSSANSLMRPLNLGSSIAEVIASVAKLSGYEPPNELWLFATCLFCSAEKQEMFATMKDPEVQLTWCIFNMNTYDDDDVEDLEDGLIICAVAKADCIGAIDGVHVEALIPHPDQVPYIGRKGISIQNVMVACNFDMHFTFACAGWEYTAHDTRVFLSVLRNPNLNFSKPPNGKYYLVDAGYPQMRGHLRPYKGERYHLPDFRRGAEQRVIKRDMPNYPFNKQVKIVIATMALHNYIRKYSERDRHFDDPRDYCEESDSSDDDDEEYQNYEIEGSHEIEALRNRIAASLMNASN
ncbi:L10-interacting MYB domain-containing protein-like [Pyrus x bretschneideri]|uniref:L10-interacting MYB domain-containing protein-like n=1 Tax=Pyrus x bretschneideri TaxID=225117 RepID=UPI00202DEEE4|nr:L10-interacting MYB domain-containing protein-like [Pyrus x bretschneideri]